MILGLKFRPIIKYKEEKVIIFGAKVSYDVSFSFEYLILVFGELSFAVNLSLPSQFRCFVDQIGEFSLIVFLNNFVLERKKKNSLFGYWENLRKVNGLSLTFIISGC